MFNSPNLSLTDMLGKDYTESVAKATAFLGIMSEKEAQDIADEKVEFYPVAMQKKNEELLEKVGEQVTAPFINDNKGAPTNSYGKAANKNAAPLTGLCNMRIGEDGKLYLLGKSEHYHVPLGHRFNGYKLLDNARKLGILNATHNNTRGFVTRTMEKEMVRTANGIAPDDKTGLDAVLKSERPKVLNRVINLETGSVAVEAGVKMMLARFYKLDNSYDTPKYEGKTPVFFVMADQEGGLEGNYHGTSIFAQTLRGLWPGYLSTAENGELYKVVSVKLNDIEDFKAKIEEYNNGKYKTAGLMHELVLMNYGGVRLDDAYIQEAYRLCEKYDTPTMADEIQSCMWYKGMYMFRLYNLNPDFVIIGKGFPGGEYPASRIITTAEMDTLTQFGALVTNGQEELASLSYLITMAFVQANGDKLEEMGNRFESNLRKIGKDYSNIIAKIEGQGHLAAIHFHDVPTAAAFAKILNGYCIDTSAQLYKVNCPPAVLFKPPVISSAATMDYITDKLILALKQL